MKRPKLTVALLGAASPAMRMTFKAAQDIAKPVRVGEEVDFDVKFKDRSAGITAVRTS